ncbi:nuclear transport factor 2 family protein [Skermania sp. ID1734]|uniref:nuclear transport factor 2 family protein n=1 Tax=Skermania sp. ID1734 TaxID=2597516 RepID=UPI00117C323C|nr:nuclear transport factor 2 family protein [Skermania sp. ID1734]TSD99641.1 nuclear transport factor 2 family protein [Skermania sp. ID1734]
MVNQNVEAELLAVERRGWGSLCNGTGDGFYGEVMTDDAVMVLANGELMDRDTVVAALKQAPPWRTYEISDVRLIDLGADSAALVYVGRAYREGSDPAFVGLMSSAYVRRDGTWRLAVYQQTQQPAASA